MQDATQKVIQRLRDSSLVTCFFKEGGSQAELPPQLRTDRKQAKRIVGRKVYEVEE